MKLKALFLLIILSISCFAISYIFYDDFEDNILSPKWTTSGVRVSETSGKLKINLKDAGTLYYWARTPVNFKKYELYTELYIPLNS